MPGILTFESYKAQNIIFLMKNKFGNYNKSWKITQLQAPLWFIP
jgi:hypothetical protein